MKKTYLIIFAIIIISNIFAYDEIYFVKQDGTGDFTNISSAVTAVQASAIIYITAGTYTGIENKNISWYGNEKDIYIRGLGNPTIDCENSWGVFVINYGTQNDIIQGITFQNCKSSKGAAVQVNYGRITLKENNFQNCVDSGYDGNEQYSLYPEGDRQGGAVYIKHANNNQESEISNNTFTHCVSFSGGALFIEDGIASILNNTFTDNHACSFSEGCGTNGDGGAIFSENSNLTINGNLFSQNGAPHLGIAISSHSSNCTIQGNTFTANIIGHPTALYSPVLIYNATEVSNNLIIDHNSNSYGGFPIVEGAVNFHNNTLINNNLQTSFSSYSTIQISNCIFLDSDIRFENQTLDYCIIQNCGNIHETAILNNCLQEDPQIDENYVPIWNSSIQSVCIDAGDPNILDNDGTRSDIGAMHTIDHDYHATNADPGRYRWVSFPVIDRQIFQNGSNTTYICKPVESQTDYFAIVKENNISRNWNGSSWNNSSIFNKIYSKYGYKISTTTPVWIPTSGLTLPEDTQLDIHLGENWVGYFVKESLTIDVAFADIWENLLAVYSEDWAWTKEGTIFNPDRCNLIYGKMYIVKVDTHCSFSYNKSGIPVDPKEREMTEGFSYTETPDYSPINISNITDPEISEIGVLLDGECIGASKVDNELVQILAFPPSDYDGTGEITFQLYNGNRSYKEIKDYQIVGKLNEQKIELLPYKFNNIRFGKTEKIPLIDNIGNYPNPFNPSATGRCPTTTIQFNLVECSSENTKVEIFNIRGQKVKTLINDKLEIGKHTVTWNGKDSNNKVVTSGVYFYKISTSDFIVSKKMIMLK